MVYIFPNLIEDISLIPDKFGRYSSISSFIKGYFSFSILPKLSTYFSYFIKYYRLGFLYLKRPRFSFILKDSISKLMILSSFVFSKNEKFRFSLSKVNQGSLASSSFISALNPNNSTSNYTYFSSSF